MNKIQIFGGHGYVGGNYAKFVRDAIVVEKTDYTVNKNASDVVYFISTVSNYNVLNDPYLDINTNLTLLMRILEQCKNTNTVFNFISSWFVYGDTAVPAFETSYCNPKGFYSITKRTAEQLLVSFCETFNIKYRILRLANVVGGHDPKASAQKNALTFLINQLKNGRDIKLYDNGNLYRDYIHNNDVAAAINLIIEKGPINEIYNISNGVPYLFKDIIHKAHKLIHNPGKIVSISIPNFHKTVQVHSMWMNNDKIKLLGYIPKYEIDQIIQDLVNAEH